MPLHRVFLGWDGPFLPRAVQWLRDRFERHGELDLSGVLVAVPGARAGRRLIELLADPAEPALNPPRVITAGRLPEALYETPITCADPLTSLFVRVQSLRSAAGQTLSRVFGQLPDEDDLQSWIDLATELARLDATLSGEAVRLDEVIERCETQIEFADRERWNALADLQQQYEKALANEGMRDLNVLRSDAIQHGRCHCDQDVVLLAMSDLNRITQFMLEQVAKRGASVTVLIQAPAEHADGFDSVGSLVVEHWHSEKPPVDTERVRVVDRPQEQAYEALRVIAGQGNSWSLDQITLGVGDDAMAPIFERTFGLADVPVRAAVGQLLPHTRPAQLLTAVARYLRTQRFDDFAALLRHPDVEAYVIDRYGDRSWLSMLDRYVTEHVPAHLPEPWLGDDGSELGALHELLSKLLPADPGRERSLPENSELITQVLSAVYGTHALDRHAPEDADLIHALQVIANQLREQASLDGEPAYIPRVTVSDAISFTLARLADQAIPAQAGRAAIELLGWFELSLDDAPMLVVTGFNEGNIPQSRTSDALLPNSMRRILGLPDNRGRYARDLLLLTSILHSREHVTLIAGRRGHDGEPLIPSRLLLACDSAELPERVQAFFDDAIEHTPVQQPQLIEHGNSSNFVIPPPQPPATGQPKLIEKLRVTAFRDYIACPYRFYLKHVLQLRGLDDRAVELDGAAFGELAHAVLRSFGESEYANSSDPDRITAFLSGTLDHLTVARFGADPPAAVVVQREQLRERLHIFAIRQATEVSNGWRIYQVERDYTAALDVDANGPGFTITGRIDRIDQHPEHGYRIVDYKTSDTARSPESTHRQGPSGGKTWIDLQLPLYRTLAATAKIVGQVELGYMLLPKDPAKIEFVPATWTTDELDSAVEEARRIVRDIRAGRFWRPKEPPPYSDAFGRICMDRTLDPAAALASGDRLFTRAGDPR